MIMKGFNKLIKIHAKYLPFTCVRIMINIFYVAELTKILGSFCTCLHTFCRTLKSPVQVNGF